MKKTIILVFTLICLLLGLGIAYSGEKAPKEIFDLANSKLIKLGLDPVIIEAVKAENQKGKTIERIKEMDEKWKAHAGIADYMAAMMESECGKYLRDIQNSTKYFSEIFVMDDKGANVAMTDKTSDYWQGDEAKFQKSFNGGQGSLFVDEVEFDDSTQAYLVQVSFPVKEGNQVIGAVTVGIDIDRMMESD